MGASSPLILICFVLMLLMLVCVCVCVWASLSLICDWLCIEFDYFVCVWVRLSMILMMFGVVYWQAFQLFPNGFVLILINLGVCMCEMFSDVDDAFCMCMGKHFIDC